MFTKINMSNFKSWRETGEVRLAALTGFFGTNSSGKSSLLQMLLLLKQTSESNDRNLVLKAGGNQDYVDLGTPHDITYGNTTDMTLSFGWSLPTPIPIPTSDKPVVQIDHLDFKTEIHAEPQKTHVKAIQYKQSEQFDVLFTRSGNNRYTIHIDVNNHEASRPRGRPQVYMKPQKCYGFSDEALRYYSDTNYLSDIILAFEQQFQRLHYLGPLREYPQRTYLWGGERPSNVGIKGELAVPALLAAKNENKKAYRRKKISVEERIASWLQKLGLAYSFRTVPLAEGRSEYEVRIKRHANSPEVLITDLGIGVSQILPVLVLCYYVPEGSTIILEQPELHLHPSVQSGLADVFIDVIQKRHVQIILESHSEHLLRRLQRRIAEDQIQPKDTALYFCDLIDGESQIRPLEINSLGQILNWPTDFFGDVAGDVVATIDAGLERQLNGSQDH